MLIALLAVGGLSKKGHGKQVAANKKGAFSPEESAPFLFPETPLQLISPLLIGNELSAGLI